ncbi:MAG: monovalent cation/H+ antiporter complex subunit F [Pseudomonadota bacterium]
MIDADSTLVDQIMDPFITIMLIAVMGALAVAAYRLLSGPGYADRFIAVDMMTGLVVAACALTALATERTEFLDVGFGLALIAFVATAAFAAFLERKVAATQNGSGAGNGSDETAHEHASGASS